MKVSRETDEQTKTAKIILKGNLDENSAAVTERSILEVFTDEYDRIELDMNDVDYISSMGIRVLIIVYKKAVKSGKKFVITRMSGKVRNILEVVGILPVLEEVS